jgi:uncharacterized protein YdaU (DUF1376 family)
MADKVDVFMPFFVGDYLADTADLSLEEHGAYSMLLLLMWKQGGSLPLDHDRLARLCRVTRGKWNLLWRVIARFFEVEGEAFTQKRLRAELAKAQERRRIASESGRAGAAALWRGHGKPMATPSATPSAQGNGDPIGAPNGAGSVPPVANGMPERWQNDGSSSSPSGSEKISPPAGAPAIPVALEVTGLGLVQAFARIRAEVFPGSLPWNTGGVKLEKAQRMADAIGADPASVADLEASMRRALERSKTATDPRERETAFAFGVWCSKFTDLREEIHGRKPTGASGPAPLPYCDGHRGGKNNLRPSPTPSEACPECQHVARMKRPRPPSEPTAFKAPDPRGTWPARTSPPIELRDGAGNVTLVRSEADLVAKGEA